MSSVDLIILGFLRKKPMSAYELVKKLETMQFRQWIKIGAPTIYQNLKKLAAKKLLSSRRVRDGEMPEKTVYRLTADGEARFLELMRQASGSPGQIFFDFTAFLINLGNVEKKEGLEMLHNLHACFLRSREGVRHDKAVLRSVPMEGQALINLYEAQFDALTRWIEGLMSTYRRKG
jgi:DNA-binding PadR family transcriptional regulator